MTAKGTRRGEFQLIAELFAPLAKNAPGALGLKDDAAFLDITPGCQLVATTDTLIAGVHFRVDDPPDLVAAKALRVNLSDLAAKGARPIGFLHALTLNDSIDDTYLESYAAGLKRDVEHFNVPLLGGDTTSGPGPLTITITAFGEVEKGKALLRSGARRGDVVCVTGTLGDGAVGLACLNAAIDLPQAMAKDVIDRYRLPQPRLIGGGALAGIATACLDISDGLVADVGHLCNSSNVGAILDRDKIPLSPGTRFAVEQNISNWDLVLGGGDDYELVFTVPPPRLPELTTVAVGFKFPVTAIGVIDEGEGVRVLAGGKPISVSQAGYRHR